MDFSEEHRTEIKVLKGDDLEKMRNKWLETHDEDDLGGDWNYALWQEEEGYVIIHNRAHRNTGGNS